MKTSSPFDFGSVKAHVQNRNAFDISYSSLFSSPCGMILPAYVEEVLAGDYIELGCSNFVRTQPAVAPAFVNFDEKLDFYFVPYRLLWSLYDSWRVGTNVYTKSSLGNGADQRVEHIDIVVSPPTLAKDLTLPSLTYKQFIGKLYSIDDYNDCFGYSAHLNFERMTDLLGYGCLTKDNYENQPSYLYFADHKVNIMRPLAYQCIIQHYYRNEDFEPFWPGVYNVDAFTTVSNGFTSGSFMSGDGLLPRIMTPDYKCFRKDRFNSVKPINGFGFNALQILSTDYDWINSLWNTVGTHNNNPNGMTGAIDDISSPTGSKDINTLHNDIVSSTYTMSDPADVDYNGITPNSLRVLLANDAMLRTMVYARKNYASLREAELGIPTKNYDFPVYLGTHSNAISLSDVESTAATEDGVIGELAGKGLGGNSSFVFKREFDEDGVIIGMHYIMPRNNYNSDRLDRRNSVLSRYDLPMPQFDNLGLQPVWLYEYGLTNYYSGISEYITGESTPNFDIAIGFESRYGQYKSRVNEIHGPFQNGRSLDYWTLSTNILNATSGNASLDKEKWSFGILSDGFFKIRPNITDQVFNVAYDGTQDTDPFLCSYTFNVTRVSNLSIMGVPSVNSQI